MNSLTLMPLQQVPERRDFRNNTDPLQYRKSTKRWIFSKIEQSFVDLILESFGHMPNLKILDVGTGPGWIPVWLSKAKPAWTIVAVDHSSSMLAMAKVHAEEAKANVSWIQADALKTDLPSEEFDLVISHLSFHEFSDGQETLKEMTRLTKKGGHLLIRDSARVSGFLLPFMKLWIRFYYAFSPKMRLQSDETLAASYTPTEMKVMAGMLPLRFAVTSMWNIGLQMVQLWAVKWRD